MTEESKPICAKTYRFSDFVTPPPKFPHGHRWGCWMLDAERLCLCRMPAGASDPRENIYEVDIERITSSWALLDWICQVAMKNWGTAVVVGDLSLALNQLFVPQHRMRPGMAIDNRALLMLTIDRDWD